jgi:hypothetical protein
MTPEWNVRSHQTREDRAHIGLGLEPLSIRRTPALTPAEDKQVRRIAPRINPYSLSIQMPPRQNGLFALRVTTSCLCAPPPH